MYHQMMQWLFVGCLLGFGSVQAAWSPPVDLSAASDSSFVPQIAVDVNGNAIAVWVRSDGANYIIQASTKPIGSPWQTPENLSADSVYANVPQIAVDASGNATAVWERSNGTNTIIQSATKVFGGLWQAPENLSADGQDAFQPQIAVDADGNATAVWQRFNGTNFIIQAATKLFGESWQAPENLSSDGQWAGTSQIAVDANGNTTAVWVRFNGTNGIIQASTKLFGGVWQAPVDLSEDGQNASLSQIAVDANGNATAVWERTNVTNQIIQASTKPFGGLWQVPVTLSTVGQDARQPQIAIDANGNATAVWWAHNGVNTIIQASTKLFGGFWQDPENVSGNGPNATIPQIAVDGNGNATAVWWRVDGTIQASAKPLGGSWQAPENVSPAGDVPQIAVDANGNATVVWQEFNGTNQIIQASTRFFGPTITRLNPNFGPVAGRTAVTIMGTDFLEGSTVMFGSTPAVSVIVNSLTTITAVAPPGTGTVDVTVTVQGMTSPITAADQYTYENQPSPRPGRFKGKVKRSNHKLFITTTWKKRAANTIARYEIFAWHKRIKKISAHKKPQAIIHLHPHSVPHHLSQKYRHYLHKKYKIRSITTSGDLSPCTQLKVRH